MKHVLRTPFYALRIPVAQVTDVYSFGDRIQEDCRLLTGGNAKPAAIAPVFVHPHRSNLFVPGEGIPIASRKAVLALDAEERCVDSFFFPYQDFNSGSPRIELLLMRKGADLFADTATAAFLMIHIDFWSGLAGYHFKTSILDLLFGSCRRLLRQRSSHHSPPLHPVRPISFLRASFLFPIISNDFLPLPFECVLPS